MARRLRLAGVVDSPVRGFHVLTPDGRLAPPIEWLDELMQFCGESSSYAVAGWSAARLYGASFVPEEPLHVRLHSRRRSLTCASGRISFFTMQTSDLVHPRTLQTEHGRLMVSHQSEVLLELMMEAARSSGGVERVLPALAVVARGADPLTLARAASNAPLTWSCRLGYLLTRLGHHSLAHCLSPLLRDFLTTDTLLDPHGDTQGERNAEWRLVVNSRCRWKSTTPVTPLR